MATLAELLPYMTDEERLLIRQIAENDKAVWRPLPGPQTMAYESKADIIGYGGAAGGGKTDLALGKALTNHHRTIVFRLNGTEHTAFIDRLEEVLGSRDGFNSKNGIWRVNLPGVNKKIQLELGSVPNPGDERKYRGRPHDLKIFDEAAEIPESRVRFLMGWLRTTVPGQHCQTLMCFNPPTSAEGRWVVSYFAPWLDSKHPNPALPGELRYFATINGKDVEVKDGRKFVLRGDDACYEFDPRDYKPTEIITPLSRTFIPARVTDNPYYSGGTYMSQLQALPEPLRSQMLNGDFAAGMEDDPWQVCPTAWVDAAMARWTRPAKLPEMESLGVDVARGGKDNTTIARRHTGMWFDVPLVYPGTQTPDGPTVCGLVIAASRDQAPQHIDVIGVGGSPYDFLVQARQPVMGINVAETSLGTDKSGRMRFANQRSELWWRMREALDPANNTGIALPPDKRLLSELCAPIWQPRGAKIYVESREDIIDRIKRSPDLATAYILALIDTPKLSKVAGARNPARIDYDPYDQGQPSPARREYDPYSNTR